MIRFSFQPRAQREYFSAINYYANADLALSTRFVTAIDATIRQIVEAPERCSLIDEDVRRCLVKKFPYSVVYTMESDYVLIIAVMHTAREPGYWRNRL